MFPKDQVKPAVILLYTVIAVTVWYYCFKQVDAQSGFWFGSLPLLSAMVLFGLIPMAIVRWGFREKLADYGVQIGVAHRTVRSFLLAAPAVIVIAVCTGHNSAFHNVYPLNAALREMPNIGIGLFVIHSFFYLGYYAGWEFLFRGFIQHGLSERCGILTAIMVQTLTSTMLHYGHPPSEVFGSILAGLAWGMMAYRTQSILSVFLQHSLLGIVLDKTLLFDT